MLYIACDHGGLELKNNIINYLNQTNIGFCDLGTHIDLPVDYPVYAKKVCENVLNDDENLGILICGTGIGISIAANRNKGIRAALCTNVFMAEATRSHNNANVLCLGGRVTDEHMAIEIVKTFLNTKFSFDERHIKRINEIEENIING